MRAYAIISWVILLLTLLYPLFPLYSFVSSIFILLEMNNIPLNSSIFNILKHREYYNSSDPSQWFMLFTTRSAAVDVGNLM